MNLTASDLAALPKPTLHLFPDSTTAHDAMMEVAHDAMVEAKAGGYFPSEDLFLESMKHIRLLFLACSSRG